MLLSRLFNPILPDNPEIIIYSTFSNARLHYTLDFIIKQIWQKNYILTTDLKIFQSSDKIKINYTKSYFHDAINVFPLPLLQSKGVNKHVQTNFEVSQTGFYTEDIFSKVFYHISRYEEWQKDFLPDKHQRFEASASSFAHQLHLPFIDISIRHFKEYIQSHYSSFETPYSYKEIYTFDLDNILAFKGKPLYRNIGAYLKYLIRKDYHLLRERWKVWQHKQEDPFEEVYRFLHSLSKKYPLIFFVLSRSNTSYDRAATLHHPYTVKILEYLKSFATIALHPSYYSMNDESKIQMEKKQLETVLNMPIIASRQHYLRINLSTTPKYLIHQGIQFDFTMGFASQAGFRAGTSYPFYYYDFDTEKSTPLQFVPFAAMDGAYFKYQQRTAEAFKEELHTIRKQIQKTGGYFIPLFHEITLSPLFHSDAILWRKFLENTD